MHQKTCTVGQEDSAGLFMGAEGGTLRDAFGALREYTEESGSQNTDVVDDFRNKQQ